jgi:hypothetical protein
VLSLVDLEKVGDHGNGGSVGGRVEVVERCGVAADREEGVNRGESVVRVDPDCAFVSAEDSSLDCEWKHTWSLSEGERLAGSDVGEAAAKVWLIVLVETSGGLARVS